MNRPEQYMCQSLRQSRMAERDPRAAGQIRQSFYIDECGGSE